MDTNLQARIQELVQKNDKIAIVIGKNPSLDDMAAALSLYLGLQQLNKGASIASTSQPIVEHSSLVGIDKVKAQFTGDSGDLVVSFPYREGEIEKVSYTIENGFLNIVVKAGAQGLQFQQEDVRYSRGGGVPQLLFIVGTSRLADLGPLFNPEALKDTTIVNIDNKSDNQGFGDVVMVSQTASSVSEIIAQLLTFLGVDLDVDISQNLLSGITVGTQNFQSPKTTSVAFEMMASLMKKGALRKAIPQATQPQQNEDQVSSFMPEHMLSQGASMPRPRMPQRPAYNPLTQPMGIQPPMPAMPQPMPRPMPRPQPQPMPQPYQQPTQQPYPQQPQPFSQPQQGQPQSQYPQSQQFPQGQPQQAAPNRKPPSDWLTPKVYKGSSDVS